MIQNKCTNTKRYKHKKGSQVKEKPTKYEKTEGGQRKVVTRHM